MNAEADAEAASLLDGGRSSTVEAAVDVDAAAVVDAQAQQIRWTLLLRMLLKKLLEMLKMRRWAI